MDKAADWDDLKTLEDELDKEMDSIREQLQVK